MKTKKWFYSFGLAITKVKELKPLKGRRVPPESIVLEVIENLYEVIWFKIACGVKKSIKASIENLLTEEVTARIGDLPPENWSRFYVRV